MRTLPLVVITLILLQTLATDNDLQFKVPENDKIGFVFELIRHGARAPLIDDGESFNIPTGNLT